MRTPALAVRLDRASPVGLGNQLVAALREQVVRGTLPAGDRLPSTRALAAELGVARSVAEQAYAQLVAEGWLEGRHGAGTYVAAGGLVPAAPRSRAPRLPSDRHLVRLDTGTPYVDPRLAPSWRRAWREVGTARPPRGYDDPRGLPALRTALAERLARTRGVDVDADAVLVTGGTTDGLRQLVGVLPDGPVGVEDPGYRAAVDTARAVGRTVVDLPPGAAGADLGGLAAAYTTPAHQHPLGRTMTGPERVSLLAAAERAGCLLVEDDYDSELRYDVAPIPALTGLARDRVAYLGTASKTVAPSLRLGWLVAPPALHDAVLAHRTRTHESAPWPVQRALLALLRDGYVDRAVRSARRVYADRAERVAAVLGPHLPGPVAGMYATVALPEEVARAAREAALAAGFDIPLLTDYCRSDLRHGLVLGFGGCTDAELDAALAAIAPVLGQGVGQGICQRLD